MKATPELDKEVKKALAEVEQAREDVEIAEQALRENEADYEEAASLIKNR